MEQNGPVHIRVHHLAAEKKEGMRSVIANHGFFNCLLNRHSCMIMPQPSLAPYAHSHKETVIRMPPPSLGSPPPRLQQVHGADASGAEELQRTGHEELRAKGGGRDAAHGQGLARARRDGGGGPGKGQRHGRRDEAGYVKPHGHGQGLFLPAMVGAKAMLICELSFAEIHTDNLSSQTNLTI